MASTASATCPLIFKGDAELAGIGVSVPSRHADCLGENLRLRTGFSTLGIVSALDEGTASGCLFLDISDGSCGKRFVLGNNGQLGLL
jgi:hypothetical protein